MDVDEAGHHHDGRAGNLRIGMALIGGAYIQDAGLGEGHIGILHVDVLRGRLVPRDHPSCISNNVIVSVMIYRADENALSVDGPTCPRS